MGAIVAFEVAQVLRKREGLNPVHVFVSGCPAPEALPTGRSRYDLSDDELIKLLRHFNGTPKEVLDNPELMRMLIPTIKADFEIEDTFQCRGSTYVRCPLTAFGGKRDSEVKAQHLLAWHTQTTERFALHILEGDHFFINTGHQLLLRLISCELDHTSNAGVPPANDAAPRKSIADDGHC